MLKPVPEAGESWGILGGVFDPIHRGHLALARDVASAKRLDGVLFTVSFRPPHRTIPCSASFEERVEMVSRAVHRDATFTASAIEQEMEQPCYTLNSVKALKRKYPGVVWYLIIGADNLATFSGWYHPEEILGEISILAGARPPFDSASLAWFPKGSIEFIASSLVDVSSSEIRDAIARGVTPEELTRLVPTSVAEYIEERGLYQ